MRRFIQITSAPGPPPPIVTTKVVFFGTASEDTNTAVSLTYPHTVPTGALNIALMVSVERTSTTVTNTVTFNGIPLTQVLGSGTRRAELWKLPDPPEGTFNIVVTASASATTYSGAFNYANVANTFFPFSSAAGTGSSSNINQSGGNFDMAVSNLSFPQSANPGGFQVERHSLERGYFSERETLGGSVAISYTFPSSNFQVAGCVLPYEDPSLSPVLFDNASGGSTSLATNWNYNHTCSGTDRGLLVAITQNTPSVNVTAVAYNGVGMTEVLSKESNAIATQFFFLVNPASGSNSVAITQSATGFCASTCASYTNVHQTTPTGDEQSASGASPSNISLPMLSVASTDMIVTCVGSNAALTTIDYTLRLLTTNFIGVEIGDKEGSVGSSVGSTLNSGSTNQFALVLKAST